jgi:hypothetical protein
MKPARSIESESQPLLAGIEEGEQVTASVEIETVGAELAADGADDGEARAVEPPDNRYVPVRLAELIDAMERERDRFCGHAGAIGDVAEAIERVIDQEVRTLEKSLRTDYGPVNPDADTVGLPEESPELRAQRIDRLLDRLGYVLGKANYERLGEVHIEHAIKTANTQGLRVRLRADRVAHLLLWVRGRGTKRVRRRSVKAPMKGKQQDLEVFRRMAVIAVLKETPDQQQTKEDQAKGRKSAEDEDAQTVGSRMVLKLFRDIPLVDLEALLPHAEVTMSVWDKLMVYGSGAGALGGLASKVVAGGAAFGIQLLWPIVMALGGMSLKSFFGYRNAKTKRTGQRTRHLYYQNLANNAGVLGSLLAHVAEEEAKEAVLAYGACARAERAGVTFNDQHELDRWVEAWIRQTFNATMNYDCPDALETLDRLGLWSDRRRWRVLSCSDAVARLEDHWRERRTERYHVGAGTKARRHEG